MVFGVDNAKIIHNGNNFIVGRIARKPAFVVIVETKKGRWIELDAEDSDHAIRLARNWVDPERMNARGATCWKVKPDGKLVSKPIYRLFETDFMNDDWLHDFNNPASIHHY